MERPYADRRSSARTREARDQPPERPADPSAVTPEAVDDER